MVEWNQLNRIISADPIDYGQIDFYLLLSNKNINGSPPSLAKSANNTIESSKNITEYRQSRVPENGQGEKKSSVILANSTKKYMIYAIFRKNLLNNLEIFQRTLVINQEKLENLNKK